MPALPPSPHRPSRADRVGLTIFIIAGFALTALSAVLSIGRIIHLLGPSPKEIPVQFLDMPVEIPVGDNGEVLTATLEIAHIEVTELPLASLIAGVAGPLATTLVTASVAIGCIALAISIMRGCIFSRRNTRLVAVTGGIGLLGFAFARLCDTMLANGAVAWATDRALDNAVFTVAPAPFLLAAFVLALLTTMFTVGERLQRETEGLV